jgi:hypothetical protein
MVGRHAFNAENHWFRPASYHSYICLRSTYCCFYFVVNHIVIYLRHRLDEINAKSRSKRTIKVLISLILYRQHIYLESHKCCNPICSPKKVTRYFFVQKRNIFHRSFALQLIMIEGRLKMTSYLLRIKVSWWWRATIDDVTLGWNLFAYFFL